jgi:hypothetical protein
MSVTFHVEGIDDDINVSNVNARSIFEALDIHSEYLVGEMRGPELAALCEKHLKEEEERPTDDGLEQVHDGRYHFMGRAPGRRTERIRQLKELAEMAGELGLVRWD